MRHVVIYQRRYIPVLFCPICRVIYSSCLLQKCLFFWFPKLFFLTASSAALGYGWDGIEWDGSEALSISFHIQSHFEFRFWSQWNTTISLPIYSLHMSKQATRLSSFNLSYCLTIPNLIFITTTLSLPHGSVRLIFRDMFTGR